MRLDVRVAAMAVAGTLRSALRKQTPTPIRVARAANGISSWFWHFPMRMLSRESVAYVPAVPRRTCRVTPPSSVSWMQPDFIVFVC